MALVTSTRTRTAVSVCLMGEREKDAHTQNKQNKKSQTKSDRIFLFLGFAAEK